MSNHARPQQQSYFCPDCKELAEKCACDNQGKVGIEYEHDHRQCASWGCPLPGSNKAGENWFCTWHFRNPVTEADAISQWANRNRRLIEACRRLSNRGIVLFHVERATWEKASIPPEPEETYHDYLNRLAQQVAKTFQNEVTKKPPHTSRNNQEKADELPL